MRKDSAFLGSKERRRRWMKKNDFATEEKTGQDFPGTKRKR